MLSVLKLGSKKSPSSNESSTTTSDTRRIQLKLAQRRHRDRREAYVEALRKEVSQLRRGCRAAQLENQNLRRYIQQHMGFNNETLNAISCTPLSVPSPGQTLTTNPNTTGPAHVGYYTLRRDHDDHGISYQLTTTLPGSTESSESLLGVNWVLSLERVCFGHMHSVADTTGPHSHQVMSQLIDAAQVDITVQQSVDFSNQDINLTNLLQLSRAFDLEDELTPVQAWFLLKEHGKTSVLTEADQLQSLQTTLLKIVKCRGFGAVIDKATFAKHSAGLLKG